MYVRVYMYVCMYECMHACMHVYMSTPTSHVQNFVTLCARTMELQMKQYLEVPGIDRN